MKKLVILRVLLILSLFSVIFFLGHLVYGNIFYLSSAKNYAKSQISLLNYREIPKLVKSWPGTEVLISPSNYKYLVGNDKVKKIDRTDDQIVANLYFKEPDQEDDAEKRSATLTIYASNPIDLSNRLILSYIETKGNIIGQGHQQSRIQIELIDSNGKTMRGPKMPIMPDGKKTYLFLRPTIDEPIPLGSARENFNPKKVVEISIRFILAKFPEGISKFPAYGKLYLEGVYLISNLESITKFFGQPSLDRISRDNVNLGYKWRKMEWENDETEFFTGINYPWNNYGWDIGKNPYGKPENSGWSANEEKLRKDFAFLKASGISPIRIYLFFDLRTGLSYTNGELTGFDTYVRKDIETLFRVAGETGEKIIPVLFDFGIADGQGNGVGEHPELIFSSEKYNFLANIVRPLLADMEKWDKQYGQPVFAIELMNEPENMVALVIPGYFQSLKIWFKDLANIIHNETSFKVTLGSHSIVDMQRWWSGVDIDIWQFHFYKYMQYEHDQTPQNTERTKIQIPGMIFCGEMQPYDITTNVEAVRKNGYNGILPWSFNANDGYGLRNTEKLQEIIASIKNHKLNQEHIKN